MATLNAAKTLGLEDLLGSLEPGKLADIVAIDMGEIESQPIYHPLSQLVYTRTGHKVSHVWVNGEVLLKDRKFTKLDQDRVIATTKEWQARIMKR